MGNGASSKNVGDFCSIDNFRKIEKMSRNGYFQDDFDNYRAVITQAIKLDAIDLVEVLVTAGNLKMLKPLHLACALGKLESVELLCSAGQSTYLKDELGRTPLHVCSLTVSNEGALCATFMILRGKKALSMFDRDGLTPLHAAAVANNVQVLRVLLSYCPDISIPSRNGKTALLLAQEANSNESVELLRTGGKVKSHSSSSKSTAVDQQRIMQIWEKFFENAFKSSGADWTEEEEEVEVDRSRGDRRDYSSDYSSDTADAKQKNLTFTNNSDDTDAKWESKSNYDSFETSSDQQTLTGWSVHSWFDWVVCYDEVNGYYALHQHTGESRWIDEHMQLIGHTLRAANGDLVRLKWASSADYGSAEREGRSRSSVAIATSDRMMRRPLPSSLHDAVVDGWCTYYDKLRNESWWLSAPTLCTEAALPLAMTESADDLWALGMQVSSTDSGWVESDQRCSLAWVLVVVSAQSGKHDPSSSWGEGLYDESADEDIDNDYHSTKASFRSDSSRHAWGDDAKGLDADEDASNSGSSSGMQYYLNRVTGETTWDAPANWETVLSQWIGGGERKDGDEMQWILCCGEETPNDLYWFNAITEESVWLEEVEEISDA